MLLTMPGCAARYSCDTELLTGTVSPITDPATPLFTTPVKAGP